MSTYKVTAATGYDGHAEGEEFKAELTEEQERRAVERGSLEVVKANKKKEASDG
jgi:hypothetical protein